LSSLVTAEVALGTGITIRRASRPVVGTSKTVDTAKGDVADNIAVPALGTSGASSARVSATSAEVALVAGNAGCEL